MKKIILLFSIIFLSLMMNMDYTATGQGATGQGTASPSEDISGGGCLIATATYNSELTPQVQQLREIRDNKLLQTETGLKFMQGFNDFYYSFSPLIADYERENPYFKEIVKIAITPMISTLTIMTLAEDGDESQVLGLGISIIALNLGMYIAAPAAIGFTICKRLKLQK